MKTKLEALHHLGSALALGRIQVVVVSDVIVDNVVKFCVDVVVTSDDVRTSSGSVVARQSFGSVR